MDQRPDVKDQEIARLRAENQRLSAQVERQNLEITRLKALVEQLQRASKRQAAPFSKGEPFANPKTPGRKPGPDYGTKAFRQAPAEVDETYEAPLPDECPNCGGGVEFVESAEQYQVEIPRKPIRRKFNIQVGRCRCCGQRVQGRHPLQTSDALGAAASQLGPDAQALATTLNKETGLSHGKIQQVFQNIFGITFSRGASAQIMLRAAERCGNAYREIQIVVRQSPWCVPDETGWKVGGLLRWLHVFVTEAATLFLIRPSRGFDVGQEALGLSYAGWMVHDGWAPYNHFQRANHQQCNAHLMRRSGHLLEMASGAAVIFPRQVKALLKEGWAVRDARDEEKITIEEAAQKGNILERGLQALCGPKTHAGNERLAKFLRQHAGEMFEYLRTPGMHATNWLAEQAIRPAVVNRKVWGGNRTENGAQAQEMLTSVLRTAVQRGMEAFEFLSQTLRAPCPAKAPRLLPGYFSSG